MIMQLMTRYNTELPASQPDEDAPSLKYALPLTPSKRQFLTRIAKSRCGHRRPAGWKRERALLQCDEEPAGRLGA